MGWIIQYFGCYCIVNLEFCIHLKPKTHINNILVKSVLTLVKRIHNTVYNIIMIGFVVQNFSSQPFLIKTQKYNASVKSDNTQLLYLFLKQLIYIKYDIS